MPSLKKTLLFISILIFGVALSAQEICDNAIDDDGDGLIDLNDEDCICNSFIESSLIPNPSFEEMTCCPTQNQMLDCAVGWIQASAPTTDYVHTCGGYLGNTSIPAIAPLPFPDGEGGVGFRDGELSTGSSFKEYVGACLTEPMVVGETYRLDFYVGFQNNVTGSMMFNMAFFGSTNCNNLPFGGQNFTIGCPTNATGYVELAQQAVSGNNEWVNLVVEFVADQAYQVLVLGPSCAINPNWSLNPYFYVDGLSFEEIGEFGTPLESVTGSICENDLVLSVSNNPSYTYQWYRNGKALIGETNPSIELATGDDVEGTYLVAIISNEGCSLSKEYEVKIPPYYAPVTTSICEEEYFIIGNDSINQPGYYEITIPAVDGCDSIVQLTLDVNNNSFAFLQDTICEGDVYSFYDLEATLAGVYNTVISNQVGCDSLIELELSSISKNLAIEVDSVLTLTLGESINIRANIINPNLFNFQWFDASQMLIGESPLLTNYQTYNNTFVYFESQDQYGCFYMDTVQIVVDNSNIGLYIPNAFSPNADGINDFFAYYQNVSLERVDRFTIYDRWGGTVFQAENIIGKEIFKGWDGTYNGQKANLGVYAYVIDAVFLDGTQKLFKGDVTLFR